MADVTRVALKGALEGHWIEVDEDRLTFGVLEDWEAPSVVRTRRALEAIIVDTDIPGWHDQEGKLTLAEGITALTRRETQAIVVGVNGYLAVPKS